MLMLPLRNFGRGRAFETPGMLPARERGTCEMASSSTNPVRKLLRVLTAHRPMEHETSLFLLVSFIDFLMTYWMLQHGRSDPENSGIRFGESNAVARWFLHGWGIRGLLYFKVAVCLFIVLATQAIYSRRPGAARFILWLGIVVTSSVVIYSAVLYFRHTVV